MTAFNHRRTRFDRSLFGILHRLSGEGRHQAVVAVYEQQFDPRLLVGHSMLEQGVVIESLGALGRLDDAVALGERAADAVQNVEDDLKAHLHLLNGLARGACRAAWWHPRQARSIAGRIRAFVDYRVPESAEPRKEHQLVRDLRLLLELLEGQVLEAEGRYADAAIKLAHAQQMLHWSGDIKPAIEDAYCRCLARLSPMGAMTRRMWLERTTAFGEEAWPMFPQWFHGLLARDPAAATKVIDAAPPRDRDLTDDWRRRARGATRIWSREAAHWAEVEVMTRRHTFEETEFYPRMATWRFEMQRRLGDRRAADAHLEPLRDLEPETGWPFVRRLCIYDSRTDPRLGPLSPKGVRQVLGASKRLQGDDDPAVRVVAHALNARCHLLLGQPDEALIAARGAFRHRGEAPEGSLRWLAPPAWPMRGIALQTWRDVLRMNAGAGRAPERWRRTAERVDRVQAALDRGWAQDWTIDRSRP